MPSQVWKCDVCGAVHNTRIEAVQCERVHAAWAQCDRCVHGATMECEKGRWVAPEYDPVPPLPCPDRERSVRTTERLTDDQVAKLLVDEDSQGCSDEPS